MFCLNLLFLTFVQLKVAHFDAVIACNCRFHVGLSFWIKFGTLAVVDWFDFFIDNSVAAFVSFVMNSSSEETIRVRIHTANRQTLREKKS